MRLGSNSVILSRTFGRPDGMDRFEQEVAALREAERTLALRTPSQARADSGRIAAAIRHIAAAMAQPA